MKIHYLLKKLAIPLFLITLFFILTTFMAELSQGADWQRMFGINLHRVLELLDLREENTLATWFSSMIFFATGLAFLLLGWGSSPNFIISRVASFIFKLTAIGAILLSADEVASIHETVGKSFFRFVSNLWANAPPDNRGYFWIVLFAPLMLGGLLMTVYFLRKVIARMPTRYDWQRQLAYVTLFLAFVCLPGVFVFEVFEWYFDTFKQSSGILKCFEETFEIIGMYSLFLCATLIAKRFQL